MGICSAISSTLVKFNRPWVKDVSSTIEILHTGAIPLSSGPLLDICPEVLNTADLEESARIVFAALIEFTVLINRNAGSGKINAFSQIACDKYSGTFQLLNEIDEWISQKHEEIVSMVTAGTAFERACCHCIADWAIVMLSKGRVSDENREAGVTYLMNGMINMATSI